METNTTPKHGLWLMTEEPIDFANESTPTENSQKETETFRDTYEFYPDSGF